MLKLDHYTQLNLRYNPFAYLNDEELLEVTEDRINLEAIADKIDSSDSCLVQFYGKKGRGKSTHLQALHKHYFPEATFYKLQKNGKISIEKTEGILFIDSFQLLSLKNQLELLNSQQKLIIGAHHSCSILNFKQRQYHQKINFSDLKTEINFINEMVNSRMKLARLHPEKPIPKLKNSLLEELHDQYQNNLRGIQESLYEFFLHPKKQHYEL